jgi:flavin reductase (DIM6/NTAB) family NADH-FMN oxidoreductase RutF
MQRFKAEAEVLASSAASAASAAVAAAAPAEGAAAPFAAASAAEAAPGAAPFAAVPKHLLVRLLFCNPACCLITANADGTANAMTVSWLTPLDNHALFLLSLNARRHSLANLRARPGEFVLCPWVEGLEALALAAGASSGGAAPQGGKLAALGARLCGVGGRGAAAPGGGRLPALEDSPAHLRCSVVGAAGLAGGAGEDLRGHVALVCQIEEAFVRPGYWADGKCFRAPAGAARPLCFAGSGLFVPMG